MFKRFSVFLIATLAMLMMVGQSLAANTPAQQPEATPGGVPTEAAAATIAATLTVQAQTTPTPTGTATICVNAFLDENGNGLHEATEGYAPDVTITLAQGFTLIGQGVSTGTETPVCFGGLQPGTYQVAQTVPPSMEMTTQANTTITVSDGQTAGLEFGSRPRTEPPTAEPSPTAEPVQPTATTTPPDTGTGSGGSPGWLAVVGFLAIAGGLTLLGVLIFLLLRK
ncbi:MAG: SdrD B-like domain-containing protein [Chloroflexota bacterium]